MRNKPEYEVCKSVATYLRLQYPNIIYHFDLGGLNLSRAQAGMMKGIQGGKGFPDLFIVNRSLYGDYLGLFIEVKKQGFELKKKRTDEYVNEHLAEQAKMLKALENRGYRASFGCGFDECKSIIDNYLK